jgi:hypothetical protein
VTANSWQNSHLQSLFDRNDPQNLNMPQGCLAMTSIIILQVIFLQILIMRVTKYLCCILAFVFGNGVSCLIKTVCKLNVKCYQTKQCPAMSEVFSLSVFKCYIFSFSFFQFFYEEFLALNS